MGAVVSAIVLAGCSGGESETAATKTARVPVVHHRAHPPTGEELRWIGALERWYGEQYAFSTLADCRRTLDRDVDPAPTERLRDFRATAARVCQLFERGNRDERRALARSDAELAAQASRRFRAADREMTRLRRKLDAYRPNYDRRLPAVRGPSPRSRVDVELSRLATSRLRRKAEIRCWSAVDWSRLSTAMDVGAFAGTGGFRAHLSASDCNRILRFARAPRLPDGGLARLRMAYALTAFTHEVEHLSGNLDEGVTECYAIQQTRGLARRLGAPKAVAAALVSTYWERVYPFEPPEYQSAECRDGGQLDLRPATSEWP